MGETELKVKLLRYTPDPEGVVAVAARLCYSADDIETVTGKMKEENKAKFINKLLDMGHLSPIEHVSFTFGIEGVSRSLLAQITRHRIASFSVKSQRYVSEMADVDEGFSYVIPPRIKKLGLEYVQEFEAQMKQIQKWYNYWCEVLQEEGKGALEDARFVLPNAAETKIVMTMNARELYHFFRLRCCNRAQWEIRELAWEMLKLVKKVAPAIFVSSGPDCVSGSCSEGEMSCGRIKEVRARYKELNA
ncbi:MAG: thymidylate synthase [Clostridia bacterium]|jgi:thymidylate synthase (FAD)|nr:hypothetical protein [Clostridiales bacterium]MDK2985942.1 thymidylate synthase [Clostridia bacterium]